MNFLENLLNLPGVIIDHCIEQEEEIVLDIRINAQDSICPHCQTSTRKLNQNRPVLIRDLSISGRIVYLRLPRRQFYCPHCNHYFTEQLSFLDQERHYTRRYEEFIYQQVKQSSIEQVSRNEQLSTDRVSGIFKRIFEQRQAKKKPRGFGQKRLA